MDLYEYEGKDYFEKYGVPLLKRGIADTVDQAVDVADKLGYPVVIKAQVKIGGRGKAGGVKVAKTRDEVLTYANAILGMDIKGHTVHRLLVEQALAFEREFYMSFTIDRASGNYIGIVSAQGGVEIETVAEHNPDAISYLRVKPDSAPTDSEIDAWVRAGGIDGQYVTAAVAMAQKLYGVFIQGDAELVEINPLVALKDGSLVALDAKVTLDNEAAFRHEDWAPYMNETVETADPREQMAQEYGLQYIGLDGSVGVIANGAGLAMSTLDVIKSEGGEAANFLDIGGGANADRVTAALRVINSDHNVKAIMVNIFGGITKCDEVANGIVTAVERFDSLPPLVVRLDGTRADLGWEILRRNEGPNLRVAPTMVQAARTAIGLAKGGA